MPVLVFQKMLIIDVVPSDFVTAVIIFLAATVLVIVFSRLITLKVNPPVRASVIRGAFRGNLAIIGLAVLQNAAGETAAAYTMVLIAFSMPFYNLFSIIILEYRSGQKGIKIVISVAVQLFKNPLIWEIFSGLAVNLMKIPLHETVSTSLSYFSGLLCHWR